MRATLPFSLRSSYCSSYASKQHNPSGGDWNNMLHHALPILPIICGCLLGCILLLPQAQAKAMTDDAVSETAPAAAEEITIEHGKINTADASPVDPGHYEIESSFSFTRAKRSWDASGDIHGRGLLREQNINLSVTVGLIENVDIAVSGGYSWIRDNDHNFDEHAGIMGPFTGHDFTDMEVSGRYRFYCNEEQRLEIAYIAGVTIPTGSSSDRDDIGTSQEFWSFNQTLVATKDWDRWTLNGDIGYSLPIGSERENARGSLNIDLALGYHILSWLQPEVELNYSHDFMKDEHDAQTLAITAGLVMPFNETLRVMIGVQQGVWGENADKATALCAAVKFAF
ncbi:MAG: transporter [Desulfobulbus sp.]|nr:transporter [Desulfobulbus sp.]